MGVWPETCRAKINKYLHQVGNWLLLSQVFVFGKEMILKPPPRKVWAACHYFYTRVWKWLCPKWLKWNMFSSKCCDFGWHITVKRFPPKRFDCVNSATERACLFFVPRTAELFELEIYVKILWLVLVLTLGYQVTLKRLYPRCQDWHTGSV